MKIEVYHNSTWGEDQSVAMVTVGETSHPELSSGKKMDTIFEKLDHAYVCTQNVFNSWSEEPYKDVEVLVPLKKVQRGFDMETVGLRSTSVGDYLIVHRCFGLIKQTYSVDSVGFSKLGKREGSIYEKPFNNATHRIR